MRTPKIYDFDTLRQWSDLLPFDLQPDVNSLIAWRVAMRVMPITMVANKHAAQANTLIFNTFRALLTSPVQPKGVFQNFFKDAAFCIGNAVPDKSDIAVHAALFAETPVFGHISTLETNLEFHTRFGSNAHEAALLASTFSAAYSAMSATYAASESALFYSNRNQTGFTSEKSHRAEHVQYLLFDAIKYALHALHAASSSKADEIIEMRASKHLWHQISLDIMLIDRFYDNWAAGVSFIKGASIWNQQDENGRINPSHAPEYIEALYVHFKYSDLAQKTAYGVISDWYHNASQAVANRSETIFAPELERDLALLFVHLLSKAGYGPRDKITDPLPVLDYIAEFSGWRKTE